VFIYFFLGVFADIKKSISIERENIIFITIVIFLTSLIFGIFNIGIKLAFIVALIQSIYFLVFCYIINWLLIFITAIVAYIQIKINFGLFDGFSGGAISTSISLEKKEKKLLKEYNEKHYSDKADFVTGFLVYNQVLLFLCYSSYF
jgi:hypothetical protein